MSNETIEVVDLVQERDALRLEKTSIAAQLTALGIPVNQYNFKPHTIPADKLAERKRLANRYTEIEKRLAEIKSINRQKENHSEYDLIKDILTETFGRDFKIAIIRECRKRKGGEPPTKVSVPSQSKTIKTYKQELNEAIELLIKARYAIDLYIQENEPQINKADYLMKVSKINKCLPPLQEIKRLKPL